MIKQVTIKNMQTGREHSIPVLESGAVIENYDQFQIPPDEVIVSVQVFEDEVVLRTWTIALFATSRRDLGERLESAGKRLAGGAA